MRCVLPIATLMPLALGMLFAVDAVTQDSAQQAPVLQKLETVISQSHEVYTEATLVMQVSEGGMAESGLPLH